MPPGKHRITLQHQTHRMQYSMSQPYKVPSNISKASEADQNDYDQGMTYTLLTPLLHYPPLMEYWISSNRFSRLSIRISSYGRLDRYTKAIHMSFEPDHFLGGFSKRHILCVSSRPSYGSLSLLIVLTGPLHNLHTYPDIDLLMSTHAAR